MSQLRFDETLVFSVLDRLIDNEPAATRELPKNRSQALRELKQSVRRDLENLLNTRQRCTSASPTLSELDPSLVNYGIPDYTGVRLSSEREREIFRRTVEDVIRKYEPRFRNVKVQLLDNTNSLDRTLHFRIDATLHNPVSEVIVFDTALEPSTGDFEVKKVE